MTGVQTCALPISKVTRIAVVGNSITEYINSGVSGAVAGEAYAMKLNMLLGRNVYTENDGRSGCYLQKPGGITPAIMSYWTQSGGKLTNVFNLKPHVITIMLGTNEWLTVAARDNAQGSRFVASDPSDVMTVVLRVRGSDLADYQARRLTPEEVRTRVEIRAF